MTEYTKTANDFLCPKCKGNMRHYMYSDRVVCDECGEVWGFEEYVLACSKADMPRMVWVNNGKHSYTRICNKLDLKEADGERFVYIDGIKHIWWPI